MSGTLIKIIERSLLKAMDTDKKVGFMVSGGIDSTTLVRLAARHGPVDTFSTVFPGTEVDELKYILEAIKGVEGHHYVWTPDPPTDEEIELLTQIHKGPVPPSVYVQYKVMKCAASKGIQVLIDGQGPDEMFGGYLWYQAVYVKTLVAQQCYLEAVYEFIGSLWHHPGFWVQSLRKHLKGKTSKYDRLLDVDVERLMMDDLYYTSLPEELKWLQANAKACGIQVISPYICGEMYQFVDDLVMEDKIRFGVSKWILRQAIKGIVPEMIRNRQNKLGFPTPWGYDQLIAGANHSV